MMILGTFMPSHVMHNIKVIFSEFNESNLAISFGIINSFLYYEIGLVIMASWSIKK